MGIVGYIVIGLVILFVLLLYLMFLFAFIVSAMSYKNAIKTKATVIEDLGDMKLSTGMIAVGVPRFRTFHKYRVSYFVDGTEYIEEAELKNRNQKVGDVIKVRYGISNKGKVSLESEAFLCWTGEMAIGYTLGLILGIVLCFSKYQT